MIAAVSQRIGIDMELGNRIVLEALKKVANAPWAVEVSLDGKRYAVGAGKINHYYVIFPLPFPGHADEYKVVPPLATAEDLGKLLGA